MASSTYELEPWDLDLDTAHTIARHLEDVRGWTVVVKPRLRAIQEDPDVTYVMKSPTPPTYAEHRAQIVQEIAAELESVIEEWRERRPRNLETRGYIKGLKVALDVVLERRTS